VTDSQHSVGGHGRAATSSFSQVASASAILPLEVIGETASTLPIIITTLDLPSAVVGVPYWSALSAAGGSPPISWEISSGVLPPGLVLAPDTGVIDGTASQSGDFKFQATVTDSQGMNASSALSIATAAKVSSPLTISTTALPSATIGVAYSGSMAAAGGAAPYLWKITSGFLPPGFSLMPDGTITGITNEIADFAFQATVTDSAGAIASAPLSIETVLGALLCGPPLYDCGYTATLVVQTPDPPFSSSSPTNICFRQNILSNSLICRMTEPTTGNTPCLNNAWNSTPSGGDNDDVVNTNTTLFVLVCSGGIRFIAGFNPTTLQMFPVPKITFANNCGTGGIGASRTDPATFLCVPQSGFNVPGLGKANGSTLYQLKFNYASGTNLCGKGIGNCPDPTTLATWSVVTDFATCPDTPQSGRAQWWSTMIVTQNDAAIKMAISWTGGQGTAHLFFIYSPGFGCQTLDTMGNGINPIWYSTSGLPTILTGTTATWFIHDTAGNDSWSSIQATGCKGVSCGTGNGSPMWQDGTPNIQMLGQLGGVGSGHYTLSPNYYYSSPNPAYDSILLDSISVQSKIAATNCSPCQDTHMAGDIANDANPLIGTTTGVSTKPWIAPYKDELIAITTNGTEEIIRFAPTYSSGTTGKTGFWARNAICAISQDRCTAFCSSDMKGNLGTTVGGQNRWDVFAYGLCGQ
jgi:hypothetical protein